jgi:hypothetical protein
VKTLKLLNAVQSKNIPLFGYGVNEDSLLHYVENCSDEGAYVKLTNTKTLFLFDYPIK